MDKDTSRKYWLFVILFVGLITATLIIAPKYSESYTRQYIEIKHGCQADINNATDTWLPINHTIIKNCADGRIASNSYHYC